MIPLFYKPEQFAHPNEWMTESYIEIRGCGLRQRGTLFTSIKSYSTLLGQSTPDLKSNTRNQQ